MGRAGVFEAIWGAEGIAWVAGIDGDIFKVPLEKKKAETNHNRGKRSKRPCWSTAVVSPCGRSTGKEETRYATRCSLSSIMIKREVPAERRSKLFCLDPAIAFHALESTMDTIPIFLPQPHAGEEGKATPKGNQKLSLDC